MRVALCEPTPGRGPALATKWMRPSWLRTGLTHRFLSRRPLAVVIGDAHSGLQGAAPSANAANADLDEVPAGGRRAQQACSAAQSYDKDRAQFERVVMAQGLGFADDLQVPARVEQGNGPARRKVAHGHTASLQEETSAQSASIAP